MHSPLAQSGNFTIHNSLFTIHNCACTSLHMARGHSPLRLAPRSHASGALTAEEWTRQSIRFLVAFWLSPLLPTLASDASVVCCFTLLLYSFFTVASVACIVCSPSARQVRLACTGVEHFARLRSGRFTAFTVTLGDDFACIKSLSQLAPRISPHHSTFPLERR